MGKDNRSSNSLMSHAVFARICQDARPRPIRELSFAMLSSVSDRPTEYLPDRSRTVVTENDSPDVGF